jgi:hypothetical protein
MVVQEAYERKKEAVRKLQEDDNEIIEAVAQEETASYYHLIGKMIKKFMTMANGKRDSTPMQWIFQTRSYGFKIRYTTIQAGKTNLGLSGFDSPYNPLAWICREG